MVFTVFLKCWRTAMWVENNCHDRPVYIYMYISYVSMLLFSLAARAGKYFPNVISRNKVSVVITLHRLICFQINRKNGIIFLIWSQINKIQEKFLCVYNYQFLLHKISSQDRKMSHGHASSIYIYIYVCTQLVYIYYSSTSDWKATPEHEWPYIPYIVHIYVYVYIYLYKQAGDYYSNKFH